MSLMPTSPAEVQELLASLREMAENATNDMEVRAVTSRIAQITRQYRIAHGIGLPSSPALQAQEIDPKYVIRPHIEYLSERLANAVRDVERGQNRMVAVSMPPRAGKSTLISQHSPLWFLRRHPEWEIMLASHDGALTQGWARNIRTIVEQKPELGIALKKDGGAGGVWQTLEGGGMYATSVKGSQTGRGARVMIIDDPIKDYVEAHSIASRQTLWDWWLSVAQTRLEPPYLVVVVMTRWHEDDFVGRLFSNDYEGDPRMWEKISLPAIGEANDVLGRAPGEPLLSPLLEETEGEALARWYSVKDNVGTYTFSSMYQQRPAPAKGAIFDASWWRFWSWDPSKATSDGRVVFLDPGTLTGGRWLDSWDLNFESDENQSGGWVVGQRWCRYQANRYLIAQQRGRWTFTQTIKAMEQWGIPDDPMRSPQGHLVHEHLVEKKANGAAAMNVLKDKISGLKPISPHESKPIRARAVTPEVESGNVYLPHPTDPGNEWVTDLLSELRNFPHDAHDDQVDALSQALSNLRDEARGGVTVPGRGRVSGLTAQRNVARAAHTDTRRTRGY